MRAFHKILIGSVAALSLISASAYAQDNESSNILNDTLDSVNDTVDGTVDALNDVVDNTVDSTVGDTLNNSVGGVTNSGDVGTFSDVLSMIEAGNADVSDISDVSDVQVVDIADVANFDANALNDALSNNESSISALQDAVSDNAALNDWLSGNAVDVSDIVAISNHQDGSVIIYTNSQD